MILRIMNIISTRDSPLPKCQLEALVNSCSMTLPIKSILLPPSKVEITKVVSAGTNTIVIPLTIPGKLSGRVIFKKVCIPFAPKSLAAFMTLLSIFISTL